MEHSEAATTVADELAEKRKRIEREVGPRPSWFLKPVGWMLSPDLVSNLRSIFRRFTDPRRWMWLDRGRAHIEDGSAKAGRWATIRARTPSTVAAASPDAEPAVDPIAPPPSGELWFDYASDLGDGVAAMYSTAYLLQADLAVAGRGKAAAALPTAAEVIAARAAGKTIALAVVAPRGDGDDALAPARLPRGEFLFVGGDTGYHVADHRTIVTRVQAPFYWAALELESRQLWDPRERRLYGIPGNHDWYDDLDGFSRLFRSARPVNPGPGVPDLRADRYQSARTIDLLGFLRVQHASYLGIALPWRWQLWGLDIYHPLDDRQRRYFGSLCEWSKVNEPIAPPRLIVCTPSPPIAFHKAMPEVAHDDALIALRLPRLYANTDEPNPLAIGACRLDLSGDVHHYARYPAPWDELDPAQGALADVGDPSYPAIVSGLGGAFLHSSDTVLGDHPPVPATVFPAPAVARNATARGTRFDTLLIGGWLRVVPILLTLLFTWVWLQDGLARSAGDRVFDALGFNREVGLFTHERVARYVFAFSAPDPWTLNAFWLKVVVMVVGVTLLIAAFWIARRIADLHARDPRRRRTAGEYERGKRLRNFFDPTRAYWPVTIVAGLGLAVLVVGPDVLTGYEHGGTIDTLALCAILVLPLVAGLATARTLGSHLATGSRRFGGVLAALHLAIQFVTMVMLARVAMHAWWWSAAAVAAYLATNFVLAPLLARAPWSRWVRASITAIVWLALVAALWIGILVGADATMVYAITPAERLVLMGASSVTAMLLGCAHFGWYLAVMSSLGFHNNELGGAARADQFRQFIRFRVTERAVTGYVIGLDQVVDTKHRKHGATLAPFVIDVFEIVPRPAPTVPVDGLDSIVR